MPAFPVPIQRAIPPTYHNSSGLRPLRDADATGKQWIRNSSVRTGSFSQQNSLSLISRQMMKKGRRILGMPQIPPLPAKLSPFQIYQVDNVADSTKSQYTFQIAPGLIGYRPAWLPSGWSVGSLTARMIGNYELPLLCDGTDAPIDFGQLETPSMTDYLGNLSANIFGQTPSPNSGSTMVTLTAGAGATRIAPIHTSGGIPPTYQIYIDPKTNSPTAVGAFFWAKIIDDPTNGLGVELWGQYVNQDGTCADGSFAFDSTFDPNIIFIGAAWPGNTPLYSQALTSHLLNRYQLLCSPHSKSSFNQYGRPQIFRGYWNANQLSGQLFYPGDHLVDDTTSTAIPSTSLSVQKGWVFVNPTPAVVSSVPTTSGNFIPSLPSLTS